MATQTFNRSSVSKTLKKHHKIKSQQEIQTPTYQKTFGQLDISPSKHKAHFFHPSPKSYIIQIINSSQSNSSHQNKPCKLTINSKTKLQNVKETICQKLKIEKEKVYFCTKDECLNYNLDYCFQQGIGVLDRDLKLEVKYKEIQRDQKGNIIQGDNIADYLIYDCLSVGGFSKVFLCRSKRSGKFYAAKFIIKNLDKSPKFRQLILNQKFINQLIDYPLLVKMHKFIQTKQFYIFILDYCPAGQLFSLMKSHRDMTQNQAKFYFIETILAIEYMHAKNIIYRDIKPQNILLDKDGHVKIADFGLAKILRNKTVSYCGSLQYMAPEIVQGDQYSFGVDHYCLGSLLFQLMIGCPPFYNPNYTPYQTKYHITKSQVNFPQNKKLSNQFIDFVTRLLDKNPKTRLGSFGGIKQILLHPWIGKFQKEKYENKLIKPPYLNSLIDSNFQSTYLPKQSIKQIKRKINAQIQQINKQKAFFQKKTSCQITPKQYLKQLSKLNQSCKMVSALSVSKKKSINNPYLATLLSKSPKKQKILYSVSNNFPKSSSKSLYSQSIDNKIKKRSFTTNAKHLQRQSCSNLNSTNSTQNINVLKNNQKVNKSFQPTQFQKFRTQNSTLHRRSGNNEKQNNYKMKFQNKTKETKKYGVNLRNTDIDDWNKNRIANIKKVSYNINQALLQAMQR